MWSALMPEADSRLAHRLDRRRRQLGPPGDRLGGTAGRGREERRLGHAALELAGDQARVAPQVGARLQHRNAAIAAGQWRELGLGQDRRLLDAAPGQSLEPQHQPRLLGEIGEVVVMQDQAHAQPSIT
jgi:hypothetical protein